MNKPVKDQPNDPAAFRISQHQIAISDLVAAQPYFSQTCLHHLHAAIQFELLLWPDPVERFREGILD